MYLAFPYLEDGLLPPGCWVLPGSHLRVFPCVPFSPEPSDLPPKYVPTCVPLCVPATPAYRLHLLLQTHRGLASALVHPVSCSHLSRMALNCAIVNAPGHSPAPRNKPSDLPVLSSSTTSELRCLTGLLVPPVQWTVLTSEPLHWLFLEPGGLFPWVIQAGVTECIPCTKHCWKLVQVSCYLSQWLYDVGLLFSPLLNR